MINKIYDKTLTFIKKNYKQLIFLLVLFVIVNYPLDYSIYISGGTINVNDRVEIEKEHKSNGTFNLAYVTELRATTLTYLLSYVVPSWELVSLEEYQASSEETMEDINFRSKLYLNKSEEDAIKIAYEKAGKIFKINNTKFNIVYINEIVDTNLKIGDVILEVNGKAFNDLEQYKNEVSNTNVSEYINLKIERNNKEIETKIKVNEIDKKKLTGISILELSDYKTNPEITLSFKDSESGPSGGLMLALAIYDKLISYDLTKGKKIVGTGTIDENGTIGQIDGVRYKLKGAVKSGADIFIAPSGENYDECKKIIEEEKYDIKLIEAETFDGVLKSLYNL